MGSFGSKEAKDAELDAEGRYMPDAMGGTANGCVLHLDDEAADGRHAHVRRQALARVRPLLPPRARDVGDERRRGRNLDGGAPVEVDVAERALTLRRLQGFQHVVATRADGEMAAGLEAHGPRLVEADRALAPLVGRRGGDGADHLREHLMALVCGGFCLVQHGHDLPWIREGHF